MWCADGTMSEEKHFLCEKCEADLNEFKSRPENRLPNLTDDFDFGDPKATEPLGRLMHEIAKRKEAFMRQRVAERKGPDHAV
jgi:transcription initiation factor IIE alpha subunit